MTQTLWQQTTGGGFDFTENATLAMVSYVQNGNAFSNINYLSDYISSQLVTFRNSDHDTPPLSESPKNFPLVYVQTTPVRKRGNRGEHQVDCQTRLIVWTSRPNPYTSLQEVHQCMSVSGALASILKQTILDGNASDWSAFYSNTYPTEALSRVTGTAPYIETDTTGLPSGRVRVTLTVAWSHSEMVT
jgi:hypothetical protein